MSEYSRSVIVAVVDDDEAILRSLEILLESADHQVRLFRSGAEFLDSGCVGGIDCLISDVGMPGMDGFELARRAQAARPALPIIFITGQSGMLDGLSATVTGPHRLFRKPFDGDELLAAVEDVLRGHRRDSDPAGS